MSRNDALTDAAKAGRWEAAVTDEASRAIGHHAVRLTHSPESVGEEDLKALRRVGLDDRAILDLTLIVAYFNFVNRVASGLGVELESPR